MITKKDFETSIKKIGTVYNHDTLTDKVYELANQMANERLKLFLEKEISVAALGIVACGTDEKSAYVHLLHQQRFEEKLNELTELENVQLHPDVGTLPPWDENYNKDKECNHIFDCATCNGKLKCKLCGNEYSCQ